MAITRRKALYIFLSSLLGMLLLLMFHRAVFVIYEILGSFYPNCTWLHISLPTLFSLDFFTMMVVVFIGGWYGVWLGLNWYHMIYEERGVTTWFHGFIPHHWRKSSPKKVSSKSEADSFLEHIMSSRTQVAPKKIIVNAKPHSSRTTEFSSTRAKLESMPAPSWSIDDAEPEKPVKKKVVRKKRVAKKTVRKTVARKTSTDNE